MATTYEAILTGEHLTWLGHAPPSTGPVRVRVELDVPPAASHGPDLARLCEEIAHSSGGISSISNPVEWQRQQRQDRPMPGREL